MSTTKDVLDELLTRCETILTASGFNTNLGQNAQIVAPNLNPDEVTSTGAIVIYDTTETFVDDEETHYSAPMIQVNYAVNAHIRIGSNNAVTFAHNMIDDIKTAVLLINDRTMSGTVLDFRYSGRETEYPDDAGDVVSVRFDFYTHHSETYGSP